MPAYRVDFATNLRPARRMDDGRLIVDATLARTGVQTYRNPDGSLRKEYRPPDEVFHADSLPTFEALPVTDDHPDEMLTSANRMQHTKGCTLGVRRDGDHMVGAIVVFDEGLIRKMNAGKIQVSNGYVCDLEEAPGVDPISGERYDVVQRNIRGNHVAIVDRGRAGSAMVRMDAAVQVEDPSADPACAHATPVPYPPLNGDRMTLDEALKELGAQKARADQAEQALTAARADLATAQGERDAAAARAQAAEQARRTDAEAHEQALTAAREQARKDAEERVAVEAKAREVLGPDAEGKSRKFDGIDTLAIKRDVIKAVCKLDTAADATVAYVDGAYSVAVKQFDAGAQALDAARGSQPVITTDLAATSEREATKKMQQAHADAWKSQES